MPPSTDDTRTARVARCRVKYLVTPDAVLDERFAACAKQMNRRIAAENFGATEAELVEWDRANTADHFE